MIKKIIFCVFIISTVFILYSRDANRYDMWVDPGVSHAITMQGSEVEVTYGALDSLSLVGTEFILALAGDSSTAVDFCEARSAGGAGFQYSLFAGKDNQGWISNQAAGNAVGYQWGFHTPVDYNNSSDTSYINAKEWLPAYFDTYDQDGTDNQPAQAVSPIEGNSKFIHHIKRNVMATTIDDGLGGEAVKLTWHQMEKWNHDTTLAYSTAQDAWYFQKAKAKKYNMEVYMQGVDNNGKDWFVGPVKIYEMWDESDLKDQYSNQRGTMLDVIPGFGGCWSDMDSDIQRLTIVVTVGNKRVACGIKDIDNDVIFAMAETVYPPRNKWDDKCGSVDVKVRQPGKPGPSYSKGEISDYEISMEIGTVDQLRGLGYWIPEQMEIAKGEEQKPDRFVLHDNYPNPFNPTTKIKFTLPKQSKVTIQVYDINGRQVEFKNFGNLNPGNHFYQFDGRNLPSGIYFYRVKGENFQGIKKMTLLK